MHYSDQMYELQDALLSDCLHGTTAYINFNRRHLINFVGVSYQQPRSLPSAESMVSGDGSSLDSKSKLAKERAVRKTTAASKSRRISTSSNGSSSGRRKTTTAQFQRLMQVFETVAEIPSGELKKQLAQELGMTERSVQVWFQNRRAKMAKLKADHLKREQEEREYFLQKLALVTSNGGSEQHVMSNQTTLLSSSGLNNDSAFNCLSAASTPMASNGFHPSLIPPQPAEKILLTPFNPNQYVVSSQSSSVERTGMPVSYPPQQVEMSKLGTTESSHDLILDKLLDHGSQGRNSFLSFLAAPSPNMTASGIVKRVDSGLFTIPSIVGDGPSRQVDSSYKECHHVDTFENSSNHNPFTLVLTNGSDTCMGHQHVTVQPMPSQEDQPISSISPATSTKKHSSRKRKRQDPQQLLSPTSPGNQIAFETNDISAMGGAVSPLMEFLKLRNASSESIFRGSNSQFLNAQPYSHW